MMNLSYGPYGAIEELAINEQVVQSFTFLILRRQVGKVAAPQAPSQGLNEGKRHIKHLTRIEQLGRGQAAISNTLQDWA